MISPKQTLFKTDGEIIVPLSLFSFLARMRRFLHNLTKTIERGIGDAVLVRLNFQNLWVII